MLIFILISNQDNTNYVFTLISPYMIEKEIRAGESAALQVVNYCINKNITIDRRSYCRESCICRACTQWSQNIGDLKHT